MKLHGSAASPFVRKVAVLLAETGLSGRVERVMTATTPIQPNMDLARLNPLRKIPALELDDGRALFDSRVICEYLDGLHDGPRMIPTEGDARWEALRLQAVGDGLLDAAVLNRYEIFMRPEGLRWGAWSEGQMAKVENALAALEANAGGFGDRVDIATIASGCCCGYLDFRYPDNGWRERFPTLAGWYEGFGRRPSMQATTPSG